MIKIWNSAWLSHTLNFFNVTFIVGRNKFSSTAILVTSQKNINPAKIQGNKLILSIFLISSLSWNQ